jgi:hypothetical protein
MLAKLSEQNPWQQHCTYGGSVFHRPLLEARVHRATFVVDPTVRQANTALEAQPWEERSISLSTRQVHSCYVRRALDGSNVFHTAPYRIDEQLVESVPSLVGVTVTVHKSHNFEVWPFLFERNPQVRLLSGDFPARLSPLILTYL